jgi:iron complex outermembrane receptor protein
MKQAAQRLSLFLAAALTATGSARAQTATQSSAAPTAQQQPAAQKIQPLSQTITVVGQLDPVTEAQSQRSTVSLEVQPQRLTVDTPADLLRDDPSVDVEERGGGGVQDDISIRGSSYEQTLVLLNGLRINDAETSHFNLDVPVPFDALGGEYILHGAGSTLYGSDAVSGVVNITTSKPADGLNLRLRAGAGSFGGNTQAFVASYARSLNSELLAGGRDFSEGFIADRDFRSEEASSESRIHTQAGDSDILLAGSDRAFGAAGFYGDYPSYERTKGWFSAITQQINPATQAALAFRRHSDVFVLFRDDPGAYPENQHVDTSWQGILRRSDSLRWQSTQLQYGLDINADQIASTSLGHHGRNRGAGYLNARFRTNKRFSFTTGLREEIFSGGLREFVPAFSASDYLLPTLKLRGEASRGFRLPTYTDLYYSDPADIGNPNLKPESAWSYEAGLDWYPSAHWLLSATGFTSRQTNVIDYVRANSSLPWMAENLTHVDLTGSELSAEWRPLQGQDFKLALTTLTGSSAALQGLQSKYAFNFPTQNALMEWNGRWKNGLILRERLRVVHRITGQLYPVFDSSAALDYGRIHPYLQITNLTNADYQEVVGVLMPPRAFAGGIELQLGKQHQP